MEEEVGFVPDSEDDNDEGISRWSSTKICSIPRKSLDAEREISFGNGDLTKKQEKSVDDVWELDQENEISLRFLQNSYSDKSLSRVNRSRIRKLYNEENLSDRNRHIGSQPPGELSQSDAMNVVEKLQCDNGVGSCQDLDTRRNAGLSSSPPNLSVKGAQCLAKWANHRNSVRELKTFDWVDSSAEDVKIAQREYLKPTQLDEELLEKQVEISDIGVEDEIYDIGPNTQMAAEAMEVLFHGSPLKAKDLIEDPNLVKPLNRTSTKDQVEGDLMCSENPVTKRLRVGDFHFNAIPVAPRTKRPKSMKVSNWSEMFSDIRGDDKFVTKQKLEAKTLRKDAYIPPKCKRIQQITSGKPTIRPKPQSPATIRKPFKRFEENKVISNRLDEILKTVKRKKRSLCIRDVPSANSTSFKPYSENDPNKFKQALSEAGSILPTVSNAQDAKENMKPRISRCKRPKSSAARELIRLEATEPAGSWVLKDSRTRKEMSKVRILFSNNLDNDVIQKQMKISTRFRVAMASSVADATHFIADRFARTKNMLEAMAMGKSVVTHRWLESCAQARYLIDARNYLLRDLKKEKEIGFSMPVSLARARKYPLLQGRRMYVTPNVKPDTAVIRSLVKAAHGQIQSRKNSRIQDDVLVISCEEDYADCRSLLDKGVKVFSSDLLLKGIIIQKLEYDRYQLFANHVKMTS